MFFSFFFVFLGDVNSSLLTSLLFSHSLLFCFASHIISSLPPPTSLLSPPSLLRPPSSLLRPPSSSVLLRPPPSSVLPPHPLLYPPLPSSTHLSPPLLSHPPSSAQQPPTLQPPTSLLPVFSYTFFFLSRVFREKKRVRAATNYSGE